MDLAHRSLKLVDQALQPTLLRDRPFHHLNPSKADTAIQLTSNNNSTTPRLALTAVSVVPEVTKQLARAIKAANTEVIKLSEATTMATTSNAVVGAATTEDINELANDK